MTGVRKEAFSWFITVLVAIVTGLVIVQLAVTLAFAAQDHSPLEVAALRQRVLDYSADDASAPQLEALDAAIVEEAAEEDSALTRANDERGVLNLPTEPPAAPNLINLLLASPTSVPTLVFENPATVTPIATNTSAASPTSITATATPLASATFTPVAQSATATPSAPPILASVTLLASTHTRTATSSATATRTAQANVTLPANTNTRTATSSATATNTTTLPTNIATASATLTRTPTATFTNTVPPTLPADVNVRLNFQPAGASVPAGYGVDSGASFGDRGNGWQYGWNQTNGTAVDRNSNLSPDQRFDTVMAMQDGGWLEWNIAVPNGVYIVHIVAGDPCCADARYRIRVEGTMVVNGWSRSGALWVEGTAQVTVTDGRLTVSNGWGTNNNKINFIDIYSGSQSPPPTAPPMSTTVSTQPTSAINNSTDPIVSPTASATPSPSRTPSPTQTVRPRNTRPPSRTPTPTRTFTATRTSSPTKTFTPSPTVTPSVTPTLTSSPTITSSTTPTPSSTFTPTFSPTPSVTASTTASPTTAATVTPTATASPSFTITPGDSSQSFETTPTTAPG